MWCPLFFLLATAVNALPTKYYYDIEGARLPTQVQPIKYFIDLTVSEDDLRTGRFSGQVTIDINVTEPIDSFPIHAKCLNISSIELTSEDGMSEQISVQVTDSDDFLTIKPSHDLRVGRYNLTIDYAGVLSDTDLEGLYRSSYVDYNGTVKLLATTQFEEFGARRAFPCFDEPSFKAIFAISIAYPVGYNAWSNSEQAKEPQLQEELMRVTFKDTPLMSTYLVAFLVSEFTCKRQIISPSNIKYAEICARSGTESTMSLALDITPQVLFIMSNYTSVEYGSLGNSKLTQAAIPDFMLGGMENWGLVTYREPALLVDDIESSNFFKQKAVRLISHELSHQWFGDYVTLSWWSDIFLNEGFATYFEYHVADQIYPMWELTKQFTIDQIQPVLISDSDEDSKALHYDTNDQAEIEGGFGGISYNKGGTVIRMLQHFLGLDMFKSALAIYLNKGPTSTPQSLWSSFDAALQNTTVNLELPAPVEQIMENWTYRPGYPLVHISLAENGTRATITQERFLLSGTDDTQWYLPVTYTTSKTNNFTDTTTQLWIVPQRDVSLDLQDIDWIVLNNQQVGYFRVDYDESLLQKISNVLNTNLEQIDEISRSQLVDDRLNLARAGTKTYTEALTFLLFLKDDQSYYSWSSAFAGFNYILQRTRDTDLRNKLQLFILDLMETLSGSVPFESEHPKDQIYTLKQVLALTWACNLGDESCVTTANRTFSVYTQDETQKPSANLRSIVYCNGLRYSTNASESFEFLWEKYLSTDLGHEQLTLLQNLGCINDPQIRKRYLGEALGTHVRIQDASYVFQSVYTNNVEGVDEVFEFITENYSLFDQHFGKRSPLLSLIYTVADLFPTQEQIDKLNDFLQSDHLSDSIVGVGKDAVEVATENLITIAKIEEELKLFFN